MNAMTCAQVDLLLELYRTGACDSEERQAVEDHLAACPSCAANLARAGQLVGLLDLHFQMPARLSRLQERLRREPLVRRNPGQVAVRRFLALAALLLVTLGLTGLLLPVRPDSSAGLNLAASLDVSAMKRTMAQAVPMAPNPVAPEARRLTEFDFKLTLSNTTTRPIRLDLDHGLLQFTLTEPDGSVVRGQLEPKVKVGQPDVIPLKPGESFVVPITRFTEPDGGLALEQPGEYTLLFRYIAQWSEQGNGTIRKATVKAPLVRFSVGPGQ